jgi:hypothetical protein
MSAWSANKLEGQYQHFTWQRTYYDHVIRSESELALVRQYIRLNPLKWGVDRENPMGNPSHAEYPWMV